MRQWRAVGFSSQNSECERRLPRVGQRRCVWLGCGPNARSLDVVGPAGTMMQKRAEMAATEAENADGASSCSLDQAVAMRRPEWNVRGAASYRAGARGPAVTRS